ncbi:MAG TPA: hypothetical protein VHB79_14465 [Polyangiaceae bacterium]|nr:hypothetical protein [Polyangiaceae bacterium]
MRRLVHLDIRPRLRLPPEPPAAPRKRWRLPPLAVPAAGYWVLMGGLTYFFAHLGPHPLEALANPLDPAPSEAAPAPREIAPPDPAPVAALTPSIAPSIAEAELASEPPPAPPRSFPADEPPPDDEHGARRSEPEIAHGPPEAAPRTATSPSPGPLPVPLSFPEFTDSSRPAPRVRAADGPRIDSLFERGGDRPAPTESEPAPPEVGAPVAVTSCEAAIARNNEQIELGAPRGPADVTREAYASILQNGRYLAGCSMPDRTVLQVCAAVKDGRAVGVTVSSNPPSSALNACVKSAVSRLKFPASPKLDVTHTRFDAVGR